MSAPMGRIWINFICRGFSETFNVSERKNLTFNFRNIFRTKLQSRIPKDNIQRIWRKPMVLLISFPSIYSIGFMRKKNVEEVRTEPTEVKDRERLIVEEADRLYSDNDVLKLYEYLVQFKDIENDEILWRLARVATDKGKKSEDKAVKRACMFEAFGYSKRALELNESNFACHKWYAILLDYTGEYEGTKQRILNAFLVKEHFLRALELNPKDATSIHSLGYWCFVFADMAWYTKKIAAALFASPPTSTYSEALYYFQKAEEGKNDIKEFKGRFKKVDPNFYSMNLLMIGKTMVRMKDYKSAVTYLIRARDYPVTTPDDQRAHTEAVQLLNSIGMKEE